METRDDEQLGAYIRLNYERLLRVAYLLCGDAGRAEDLVQTALMKAAMAWERLRWEEGVDSYVRRVLVNTFISAQRRRSWWERPLEWVGHQAAPDSYAAVDERDVLRRALRKLPVRQRTAVVLRHYQGLSQEQTAEAMGCSVGTVKSLSSRGLSTLRSEITNGGADSAPQDRGVTYAHGH